MDVFFINIMDVRKLAFYHLNVDKCFFSITLVFSASNPKNRSRTIDKVLNGMILLKFLRFPLNDSGYYERYETLQEIGQVWDRKKHLRRKRWSQE